MSQQDIKTIDEAYERICADTTARMAKGTVFDIGGLRRSIRMAVEPTTGERAVDIQLAACALTDILRLFRLIDADPVEAINELQAASADVVSVLTANWDRANRQPNGGE